MDANALIKDLLAATTNTRKEIEQEAAALQTRIAQMQQRLNELARAHDRASSAEEAYTNALAAITQTDRLPETTTSPIIEADKEAEGSAANQ